MLDVGLCYEGKDAVGGFQQCRVAPTVAISLGRCEDAAETGHGRHFGGRGQRKEAFVGLGPLLHPPARSLCDAVDSCGGRSRVGLVGDKAEGDAIVVQTQHHRAAAVFVGLVGAVAALAGNHLVVGDDVRGLGMAEGCNVDGCLHLKHGLLPKVHYQGMLPWRDGELAVRGTLRHQVGGE